MSLEDIVNLLGDILLSVFYVMLILACASAILGIGLAWFTVLL